MDKKLLMVPGYLIGCGGLALITYRTLLAIGSSQKAIIIQVNRYGEQYADLLMLGVLWVVCLVGMWSLSKLLKEQGAVAVTKENTRIEKNDEDRDDSFVQTISDKVLQIYAQSFPMNDQGYVFIHQDERSYSASVSIVVMQENTQEQL